MNDIYLKSYAKINLSLDVLKKRKDGYHNINTIFQRINLFDELDIKLTDKEDCIILSEKPLIYCVAPWFCGVRHAFSDDRSPR